MNLKANHRSDIIAEALDAGALVFGSPTLNNGVLPRMAGLLSYMKGLKPRKKIGAAFGSYGWSGEAVKLMNKYMEEMKFDIIEPGIRVKYVPTYDHLKECVDMGKRIKKHMENTDMGRDIAEDTKKESPRILRRRVRELLGSEDFEQVLRELKKIPPRKAINSLISVFYDSDPELRLKAISAFGQVVADLANEDMEAARVVMRRLMWMLNDESGGIGWGAPEAMAEAMACHPLLAEEYVRILLSYIREDGNFLEYEPLRRGALWGIERLAQVHPEMLIELDAAKYIRPYLEGDDKSSRELSAQSLKMLGDKTDY
jgi:hypothetical protein